MVREVIERTTEVERTVPVPTPIRPRVVADWIPLLEQLERQVRDNPQSLVRGPDDFHELAEAVLALYKAFSWRTHDPSNTAPPATSAAPQTPAQNTVGLSRQQRRARERARRRHG